MTRPTPAAIRAVVSPGVMRFFAHRRKILRTKAAESQGQKCIYCEAPFTPDNPPTFEHIIPKSKGGLDEPSNCAASCGPCNRERGRHNHEIFMRRKQKDRR